MEAPGRQNRSFPLKSALGFIIFRFPFRLICHASSAGAATRSSLNVAEGSVSLVTDIHTTRKHGRYVTMGGDEDGQPCVNIPCDCELYGPRNWNSNDAHLSE